jgi:transglutaminase-like putative cysteine protease
MKSIAAGLLIVIITRTMAMAHPDVHYPVSEIPEELKADVNAVIRDNQITFSIHSKSKASLQARFVVTILNGNGSSFATLTLGYDRLTRISSLNAVAYDAGGNVIRRLKPGDINDFAAFDGFSLYSDDRLKSVNMKQSNYPYTVEFAYEIDYKYLYGIPGFVISNDERSLQHATYQLIFPSDLAPRYRVQNWTSDPIKEKLKDGSEKITWTFENIRPIALEPHGPLEAELTPRIMAAPTVFEYDGYLGDMSSWKEYGKWQIQLNKDRDVLPEPLKAKVKELTSNLSTVEEKARVLYSYLQSKTRYVNIAEGIGGLQPFPATTVEEKGYGDCKALSNYMVSILKEAGIKGYYTKIRAGDDEPEIIREFPSHQTNHIIVAVPNGKDTLWMECTSQTTAFGYMGTFTGDRTAIMVTEEGGKLVRTPAYSTEQNRQYRTADVSIDATGAARAKVRTIYTGTQTENGGLSGVQDSKYEEQKKWVQSNIDIPNFNIGSFSIVGIKSRIPTTVVRLNLDLIRYASVSGKRLFVTPNLMNRNTYVPEKVADRKTEVVRRNGYIDLDTINVVLPEALYPEFIPPGVKLNSRFGEFEATYAFEEGKIVYIRKLKMLKGRFPKESYNEFIDFMKGVNKSDNIKLVLLNKT